jgi:hypothetical protein
MIDFSLGLGFYSTTTTGSGLMTASSFFGSAFKGDCFC